MKVHTISACLGMIFALAGTKCPALAAAAPSGVGSALVGFVLHNPTDAASTGHWLTFGQAFPLGALAPTASLYARGTGQNRPVQMDVLAVHTDGSVRFAAITMPHPQIPAHGALDYTLTLRGPDAGTPVDLAALAPNLTVALTVTRSPLGAFLRTVDLGAALQASLAAGQPDYWLQGPLATEARVDVPVGSSLHLTADITCYADASCQADVQFNNDLAMTASGGTFTFSADITLNGKTSHVPKVVQDQYQDWHVVVGGHPAPNVQHDIAYLENTGSILSYGLKTGVAEATLQGYAALAHSRGFGAPLAVNGVTTYMPMTGGRPDIGYQTQYDTVWLVTQDSRAEVVGLAQGDTGGAVPWNMKLTNGHWLTPGDYPNIWDPAGSNLPLTQQSANTVWSPDPAHQPDLGYVPYLMTAQRWYLDRLNAEFAWDLSSDYPPNRCTANPCIKGQAENLINGQQLRGAAWSMREAIEAAWIGRPGSFEAAYAQYAVDESWDWVISQESAWAAAEGQAAGWFAGSGWAGSGSTFYAAPWQQDFFDGIVIQAARMGDTKAQQVINWDANWILGRFNGPGMNPYDGCASSLAVLNDVTMAPLTTWTAIEAENVATGLSNGTSGADGWPHSQGYYCSTWRAVLGGILSLSPGNAVAKKALNWLNAVGAPYVNTPAYQADPTWNVVP